ncbi:dactylin [Anaeramoeba ignava]|uniref:Dactylin n=1 Tax=Anaeramoeba ignava TaxID=1746090 RepID=A0A9Q0LWY2_ANAIG|nr:dactylin [Anaeramoeba ignava]
MDSFLFELKIFKEKGVCLISKKEFQLLTQGNFLNTSKKNQISPKETNLILDQLPPEILIMICQYLSPGAFTRLGITCKDFYNIFNDQETWRKIAKIYQNFFVFDRFELVLNNDPFFLDKENCFDLIGFQTNINEEIENISIRNQNINFPNLDQKHFKEIIQKREKRIEKYSNNNQTDNSTILDEKLHYRVPLINSTEEERIKFINLLENPKEEMLEKARKIFALFSEAKIKSKKEKIRKIRNIRVSKFESKTYLYFSFSKMCISFGASIYLILITLKIENKINTKLSYLTLSVLIPLFPLIVLFLINFVFVTLAKFGLDIYNFFVLSFTSIMVFIQFLLIALKVDDFLKTSWIVIFIPILLVFVNFVIYTIVIPIIEAHLQREDFLLSIFFFFWIVFFIFLGLKIDEKIKWNFGIIFIPLFLQIVAYLISLFRPRTLRQMNIFAIILYSVIFPFIWIVISILFILYLEKIGINHVYYPLIPFYFACLILDIGFVILIKREIQEF